MGLGRKMCTWRKRKSANFLVKISYVNCKIAGFLLHRWSPSITGSIATLPPSEQGGGVSIRKQRSRARSRRGGVSENQIAGAAAARLFFLTAVAVATRPFKYHENSVTNTTSSFVSSIHSFGSMLLTVTSIGADFTKNHTLLWFKNPYLINMRNKKPRVFHE